MQGSIFQHPLQKHSRPGKAFKCVRFYAGGFGLFIKLAIMRAGISAATNSWP